MVRIVGNLQWLKVRTKRLGMLGMVGHLAAAGADEVVGGRGRLPPPRWVVTVEAHRADPPTMGMKPPKSQIGSLVVPRRPGVEIYSIPKLCVRNVQMCGDDTLQNNTKNIPTWGSKVKTAI